MSDKNTFPSFDDSDDSSGEVDELAARRETNRNDADAEVDDLGRDEFATELDDDDEALDDDGVEMLESDDESLYDDYDDVDDPIVEPNFLLDDDDDEEDDEEDDVDDDELFPEGKAL